MRIAAACCAALVLAGAATAGWQPAGGGAGAAKSKTMPTLAAAKPTATVNSNAVTVTWTASTFPEGGSVPSYVVKRYDALGNLQTVGAACAGLVTGTTCTESGVPAGTWMYSITPAAGSWRGVEGPQSDAVVVTP
jgi:hypothetical protein